MNKKGKIVLSVVVLVPLLCANAQETQHLRGDDVPQYYVVRAFFSEVQTWTEGEYADPDRLHSLVEELGVAKCSGSTAELVSLADDAEALYLSVPAELVERASDNPVSAEAKSLDRAVYTAEGVGRIFGRLLSSLREQGCDVNRFEAALRGKFVGKMGLSLGTSDAAASRDIDQRFRSSVRETMGEIQ